MHSGVVPESHHVELKRKALETELLASRKEELDAADARQRKLILKDIKKTIEARLKDECNPGPSAFIIR